MKLPPITYYAAKRNGDAGQEFGVAYAIIALPDGRGTKASVKWTTMVETNDHGWIEMDLTIPHLLGLHSYFLGRVAMGWFIEVDHPYSQQAVLWRLTSDTEDPS